jgi:hypothetical protein
MAGPATDLAQLFAHHGHHRVVRQQAAPRAVIVQDVSQAHFGHLGLRKRKQAPGSGELYNSYQLTATSRLSVVSFEFDGVSGR